MLHQPSFGRRLRQLRLEQGLSQGVLGGTEISASYLSRLESGARQPTARVAALLAERLGVSASEFQRPGVPNLATSLAGFCSAPKIANAQAEQAAELVQALQCDGDADPALRWQALWTIAQLTDPDLDTLAELVTVANQIGAPTLVCRSEALHSRWLRICGRYEEAERRARAAVEAAGLEVRSAERALALQSLIAAQGDLGAVTQARQHCDDLLQVVAGQRGSVLAEALWTNSRIRLLEGAEAEAIDLLDRAVAEANPREDLTLWLRVHLAAASLHIQLDPPQPTTARQHLSDVEPFIERLAAPRQLQEYRALRAHLALHEGEPAVARALAEDLLTKPGLLLSHRDRVRLRTLIGRALILIGDHAAGLEVLSGLAQEVRVGPLEKEIYRAMTAAIGEALRPAAT